jgi:ribonucleoside-diphosphate reductase alpha chain
MTRNPEIRFAKSIVDYIFRWLATKFLSAEAQFHAGVNGRELDETGHAQPASAIEQAMASKESSAAVKSTLGAVGPVMHSTIQNQEDAPPCSTCGAIMIRSGACYKCSNCGNTSGCA